MTCPPATRRPTCSRCRAVPGSRGLEVEGLGIVFLEAAACGKPAVAGRSGGAPRGDRRRADRPAGGGRGAEGRRAGDRAAAARTRIAAAHGRRRPRACGGGVHVGSGRPSAWRVSWRARPAATRVGCLAWRSGSCSSLVLVRTDPVAATAAAALRRRLRGGRLPRPRRRRRRRRRRALARRGLAVPARDDARQLGKAPDPRVRARSPGPLPAGTGA